MPRVTLADVARKAGVSRTAASFVMTGRSADMRISEAATQKVLEAAAELGYRPNLTARSLRTSKTHTIGLVSDVIATTPFAGEVIHGALDAALARGHLLLVAETGGDSAVEADLISEMLDRQVDGVIYAAMHTQERQPPEALAGVPAVLINCIAPGSQTACVLPDEYEGGRAAATALLDSGHRDGICAIGGHHDLPHTPGGLYAGNTRMRGIEDVLGEAGAALSFSIECQYEPEFGYRAVRELLERGQKPEALICLTDRLAMGAYQALSEKGLDIPHDVSVVSFDGSDLASWLRPRVTSVALPHYELGTIAVNALLDKPDFIGEIFVPMPVRAGESIANPDDRRDQLRRRKE